MTNRGAERSASGHAPAFRRLPLLALGFLSLLGGTLGGLYRFGWIDLPAAESASAAHGALMVCGFFGTLIGLERAVALGRWWGYGAPALAGPAGLAAILGVSSPIPEALFVAAGFVLAMASLHVALQHRALFTATIAAGALCWLAGNIAWLAGADIRVATVWWMLFLLLTIAGERLELRRLLRPQRGDRAAFLGGLGLLATGAAAATVSPGEMRLLGVAVVALALWLLRYDVARRTVRQEGLVRFAALCLLSGYGWLALSGLLMMAGTPGGLVYDALLHAFFLGFVFAMVFAHAPIILPAVTRFALPYRPAFYLHFLALQLSLALRIAGDLAAIEGLRTAGAAGNAIAILLFLGLTVGSVRRADAAGRQARHQATTTSTPAA